MLPRPTFAATHHRLADVRKNIAILVAIFVWGLLVPSGTLLRAQGFQPAPRSGNLPDPRFRRPLGLHELQNLANLLCAKNGVQARILIVEDQTGSVPVARVSGTPLSARITLNPHSARMVPPNTWAFILGHEMAHLLDARAQMRSGQSFKAVEWSADEIGSFYAIRAGFSIEAHLAWVFSRPDGGSPQYGNEHERATRLGQIHGIAPVLVHQLIPCYLRGLP